MDRMGWQEAPYFVLWNAELEARICLSQAFVAVDAAVSVQNMRRKEIRRLIIVSREAFGKHYEIMSSRPPLPLKRKVRNHCALPLMAYDAETL